MIVDLNELLTSGSHVQEQLRKQAEFDERIGEQAGTPCFLFPGDGHGGPDNFVAYDAMCITYESALEVMKTKAGRALKNEYKPVRAAIEVLDRSCGRFQSPKNLNNAAFGKCPTHSVDLSDLTRLTADKYADRWFSDRIGKVERFQALYLDILWGEGWSRKFLIRRRTLITCSVDRFREVQMEIASAAAALQLVAALRGTK